GQQADIANVSDISTGVYGTAVATMGMLMPAAYVLAMDTFGPITDNAGGITEMAAGTRPEARQITDQLDTVGNTTKALTMCYAVVSAALALFLPFTSFVDAVRLEFGQMARETSSEYATRAQALDLVAPGDSVEAAVADSIRAYRDELEDR